MFTISTNCDINRAIYLAQFVLIILGGKMQLDIFNKLANEVSKVDVGAFIKELTERLEMMEKQLVVDRFEENIAVCEDRTTGKTYNIELKNLPQDVREGDIIKLENGKYVKDEKEKEEISDRINEKMNNLWN